MMAKNGNHLIFVHTICQNDDRHVWVPSLSNPWEYEYQNIRQRYAILIKNSTYSPDIVSIESSVSRFYSRTFKFECNLYIFFTFFQDVERIMRIVQANLAGIFPTVDNPIWNEALKSLEIPIQDDSAGTDYRFLMSAEQCEYYNYVMQHYLMESSIKQKFEEHKDLIDHLEGNSGFKLKTIQDVRALYDALQIEYSNGNTCVNINHGPNQIF